VWLPGRVPHFFFTVGKHARQLLPKEQMIENLQKSANFLSAHFSLFKKSDWTFSKRAIAQLC